MSKSRPILMSAPMVLATLGDLKTQTRRVLKPRGKIAAMQLDWLRAEPRKWLLPSGESVRLHVPVDGSTPGEDAVFSCPYGVPGDEMWVRETWCLKCDDNDMFVYNAQGNLDSTCCWYGATDHNVVTCRGLGLGDRADGRERSPWVPSIHMPRWASRLTLRVLSVRVEKLQEISEADAIAEGIRRFTKDGVVMKYAPAYRHASGELDAAPGWAWQDMPRSAVDAYSLLWDHINGDGAWALDPWVWRVEFERVKGNA